MDYQAAQWLQNRIGTQWVGKDIQVRGVITSLPIEEQQYTSFVLHTDQFAGQPDRKHLQLSWQNPHPPLKVGDRWELTVRLKPPHALVNFNAFNRLRLLWTADIHATGYVLNRQFQQLNAATPWFWIARIRQRLQQQIKQSVHDPTVAAVISALTIGVENGLTDSDWQTLQRTGTVHLVVIAGLHIGLMVLITHFLCNQFWRRIPYLALRLPAQHAAALCALVFACGYTALAGLGIPAERALIGLGLMTIAQLSGLVISEWRRILMAFAVIILLRPGALFLAGFWLSFGAVSWIAYAMDSSRQTPRFRQWLHMQWALFLGLAPLTMYFFQQFSLVSLLANLPAIIWIGWVIVPLCLLAAVCCIISSSIGAWLFQLAGALFQPMWRFLQWLAEWPLAGMHHACSNIWILLVALAGAAWCLAPPKVPARWLGVIGLLPIWLVQPSRPAPGAYWLTMLDVGQGLSLVVQTATHLLVYDAGAHIPAGFDAGRDVVSPYLLSLGAKQIDLLMISHGDNDHSGGAGALLAAWPVQQFLTSIPKLFPQARPEHCSMGQHWEWDGVPFTVLWPPAGSVYQDNNSSCVLEIGAAGQRTLLTGDIEYPTEAALLARYGSTLQSAFLQVPHHGSRTSSTLQFLQAVAPKVALFSLGYFNRFHFPAPSVAKRYRQLEIPQYLTANEGAIRVKVNADGVIKINSANTHHYFWQN